MSNMTLSRFIPSIVLLLSGLTTPHANALISMDADYVDDINNSPDRRAATSNPTAGPEIHSTPTARIIITMTASPTATTVHC
jgi:hypothetical protein